LYSINRQLFFNFRIIVRSNSPLVKNLRFTTTDEDFEFKKLLINTLVILSRNSAINEVILF